MSKEHSTILETISQHLLSVFKNMGEAGKKVLTVKNRFNENPCAADVRLERNIAMALGILENNPFNILSEEIEPTRIDGAKSLWVFDGIDGSSNCIKSNGRRFASMIGHFSVTMGTKFCYMDCAGIVDYLNQQIYSAEKGAGVFVNDERVTPILNPQADICVDEGFEENIFYFSKPLKEHGIIPYYSGSTADYYMRLVDGNAKAICECSRQPRKDNLELIIGYLFVKELGGVVINALTREELDQEDIFLWGANGEHIPFVAAINMKVAQEICDICFPR